MHICIDMAKSSFHYIFLAKGKIMSCASFHSIRAKTEILYMERKNNEKKVPLKNVNWIVRYVFCCLVESQTEK